MSNKYNNFSLISNNDRKYINFFENELSNRQRKMAINIINLAYERGYQQAKNDIKKLKPKKLSIYNDNDYFDPDDYY